MINEKLTVVTPSFNQGRFLESTMRSVIDQGYQNLEYIVMDGGSTDDSGSIIRRFEKDLAYWQCRSDGGQGAAIVDGWKRGTGEFVTWINSDDLLLPGSLRSVAELAETGADIISGDEWGIDCSGRVVSKTPKWRGPRWLFRSGLLHFGQPGTFYRRSLVEEVGYFDTTLEFSMEFDLEMRLLRAGAQPIFADQPLAANRHHAETKSWRYADAFDVERRQVYASHIAGPLGSYRVRESMIAALRYPYALRYLSPQNWSAFAHRVSRTLGRSIQTDGTF